MRLSAQKTTFPCSRGGTEIQWQRNFVFEVPSVDTNYQLGVLPRDTERRFRVYKEGGTRLSPRTPFPRQSRYLQLPED